jgi:hypothetical protein
MKYYKLKTWGDGPVPDMGMLWTGSEVEMTEQSDLALAYIICGWPCSERRFGGGKIIKVHPDDVRLDASREYLRRYPEPTNGSGWKCWAGDAWRKAKETA